MSSSSDAASVVVANDPPAGKRRRVSGTETKAIDAIAKVHKHFQFEQDLQDLVSEIRARPELLPACEAVVDAGKSGQYKNVLACKLGTTPKYVMDQALSVMTGLETS
eukprot:10315834-Alexandrium_andersonii.AAC.1